MGGKGSVTDETPHRVNEFKFSLVVLSLGLQWIKNKVYQVGEGKEHNSKK